MNPAEMMTQKDGPKEARRDTKAERAARLERALRDNLRRRKDQARARADEPGNDNPVEPADRSEGKNQP